MTEHSIWVLVGIQVASSPIQFLVIAAGRITEDGPSDWRLGTHTEDPDETFGLGRLGLP